MEFDPILKRKTLGPYNISKKLGEGGMGSVYLGYHRVLEVNHALKIIHPRMTNDPQLLQRFFREARHAARLVHPYIVQVVGADQVDGTYYLAMQYVEGATLAALAKRGAVSPHQAVRYVHMVAQALQYAHAKNIIHRDIKPGNIMIDKDDVAKLMDFGLVRDVSQEVGEGADGQPLTGAGLMVGTPQYMPPEQWNAEAVDARADIFALGVSLYNLLSGEYPYSGKTMAEICRSVLQGKATSVNVRNPKIDPDLASIVGTATQVEREKRYQSGDEFAAALAEWFEGHPPENEDSRLLLKVEGGQAAPATLGAPSRAFKSTTRVKAVQRSRNGDVVDSGVEPTVSGPGDSAAPGRGGRRLGILAGSVGLVAILVVAGVWLGAFGGRHGANAGNTAGGGGPMVKLPADQASESNPIRTAAQSYSIPGDAAGAGILLDGKPYEFGTAVPLRSGMNRFEVAAASGDARNVLRVVYVFHDPDPPVLEAPALAAAHNGELALDANSFAVAGTVQDADPGVRVELVIDDGAPKPLTVAGGRFSDLVTVGDRKVKVELRATDRAGNSAPPLTALLVPDRESLKLSWDGETTWFATRKITLKGMANKTAGVMVKWGQTAVPVDRDGRFTIDLELDPGKHALELEATDSLGRQAKLAREVTIALEAPKFLEVVPASGSAVPLESAPGRLELAGRLGSAEAKLTVGGAATTVQADGTFRQSVAVAAYGELAVVLEATDPAGRATRVEWKVTARALRYRRGEANAQGCVEYVRLADGMTMVAVPDGEFTQGMKDAFPDAPARKTKLSPFLIAKYEVSAEQFAKFLNAEKIKPEDAAARQLLTTDKPGTFAGLEYANGQWNAVAGSERLPAVGVTWNGARAYAKWADPEAGDLPSEAQWEFAARGTDGRMFPWGAEAPNPNRCNFLNAGFDEAQVVDVCAGGVSPFGVFNLTGNVEEWCLDWYDVSGYGRLPADNPVMDAKPPGADRRVVRGGSYVSPFQPKPEITKPDAPCDLCAFARGRRAPATGAIDRGFRTVSNQVPP